MTTLFQPGKLVSLRGREWIVLPSDDKDLLIVKPLGGSDDEIAGIYLPLGIEADQPADARFAPPSKEDLGNISTARLLYDFPACLPSAPVRSCACQASFRPRPPDGAAHHGAAPESVRLLIADDVGGKTVEALRSSKSCWNAADKRFAVVCLCTCVNRSGDRAKIDLKR